MHSQERTAQLGRGFPVLTGKYSTETQQFIHTQAGENSTARRFPVLTGKCITKATVVNAQAGKESTSLTPDRHSNTYMHMGNDRTARQSFSYITRQAQHRQALPHVPTASIANLGKVFHGFTSMHMCSIEERRPIHAMASTDSPASFAEIFFLTGKYSTYVPYSLRYSYTDRHGNHSFDVVFFLTGKYSTYRLGFSYTHRHGGKPNTFVHAQTAGNHGIIKMYKFFTNSRKFRRGRMAQALVFLLSVLLSLHTGTALG